MSKTGHTEEEILRVLREAESGDTAVEVLRNTASANRVSISGRRRMQAWD